MSAANEATIEVAAGIILRDLKFSSGQLLIAKRPSNKDQGELWEFPGGKLEGTETPVEALARELREEIGIQIIEAELFEEISYQYPDKLIKLWFFRVLSYSGNPRGMEGQKIKWVSNNQLDQYPFPAANHSIIRRLNGSTD